MHIEPGATVVFLGPSLALDEAAAIMPAVYLPPVQQGTLYRAALARPRTIAIIDGYFSWVPSVWHKEILWALNQGIRVCGAASMGALRAAELDSFGMTGHGRVYEDYAASILEDDDEVAVMHAVAELGFRPLSDAMVNIRYTLTDAVHAGVIPQKVAASLLAHFKQCHFPERHLSRALDGDLHSVLPDEARNDLQIWLRDHYRNVKEEDARGLLRLLASGTVEPVTSPAQRFEFQATVNWAQLADAVRAEAAVEADATAEGNGDARTIDNDAVLVELQLEGGWPALEAMAIARLATAGPSVDGGPVTEREYIDQLARLCLRLGLPDLSSLMSWAAAAGWSDEHLVAIVSREVLLTRARSYWLHDVRAVARELLQLDGRAESLAERSRLKRTWLDAATNERTASQSDPSDALAWYRDRVGMSQSGADELAAFNGWSSKSDMMEDVLREHAFQQAMKAGATAGRTRPSLPLRPVEGAMP